MSGGAYARELSDVALMAVRERLEGCPACGEAARVRLFVKDGWPIARCPACTLVYVDARLDRAALDELYGREYFEGETFADYIGEHDARLASAQDRAARLAAIVPGGRLLDVGCAAGYFLEAASARFAVTGVEVSEFAAQHAREEFGHTVFTGEVFDAPLEDAEFDVVTMWDVVEHLRDPRAALAEVARVMRIGGLLMLTTGNVEGPLARRNLEHWNLMFPPGHLTFFSPRSLERLLNRAGFEVARIVSDGRTSERPVLTGERITAAAGLVGVGNVMTVHARRVHAPRPRPLRARVPAVVSRLAVGRNDRAGAGDDLWLDVAQRCPYATIFHTPMWRELAVEGAGGCRDASFALTLPSGVRAVFPLQELLPRHRGGRYLTSTFPYGFGGPIADGTLTADDLRRLYRNAQAATTIVTGNPLAPDAPALWRWSRQTVTTQMLDLASGYDELTRGFSKGHRAAITQSAKSGVTTRIGESEADYRSYYAVYEDSLRRWGDAASPRYPWSLFDVGRRLAARHPDAMRLWLAEHEGEVIAGAWVFYWNGHVMYWHAAALERAFGLRPANLVLANALEHACESGCRWFDFGSSGGHEGPEAFKRRFGAVERPFLRLEYVAPHVRVAGALHQSVARVTGGTETG